MRKSHNNQIDSMTNAHNNQIDSMSTTHKNEHNLKDQKHNQLVSDLKNTHLDELKRHREEREQREANNRAYLS